MLLRRGKPRFRARGTFLFPRSGLARDLPCEQAANRIGWRLKRERENREGAYLCLESTAGVETKGSTPTVGTWEVGWKP